MTVAMRPITVPSRANPRKVKAVNPNAIERYALLKNSRKRLSGPGGMKIGCWGCDSKGKG